METVENQTRPLFSGTGTATDLVRTAIKELRPDAILARPSTFPHYLRPEDFVHPVIIGNLGAGDEHLNPFKKKESHIRLVLNQSKEARNGSARSVAELTELLALMLGRRAHQGLALASHETTEHFHNQHRGFLDAKLLKGAHWFCFGSGQQVRFLLPLLWSLGIKRVTLCNRTLKESEYEWVTELTPHISRTAGLNGAMHVEIISHAERDAIIAQADVVSLHVPAHATVTVDKAMLAQLKPSAFVINVSRGRHVDETAVVAALEAGLKGGHNGIAGFAADVIADEAERFKNPAHSPLWEYYRSQEQRRIENRANLILLPHIGGSTVEAFEGFCGEVIPIVLAELGITGGSPLSTEPKSPMNTTL